MNETKSGDRRLAISNALVALYRERYGRGPTQAKTYILDDLVVVVLRGGGIPIERTLVERGREELVSEVRRAFQDEESAGFLKAVEDATGRRVANFLSQHDPSQEISVEVFLLDSASSEE